MYVPQHFSVSDARVVDDFVRANGFATLVCIRRDGPFATHVPLLLEGSFASEARLLGHVARANPHWREFDGEREFLAVFAGPHAYVSPAWYVDRRAVPTWNYAAVHVSGPARTLDDPDQVQAVLNELLRTYEGSDQPAWREQLPAGFWESMSRGIVAFELTVRRWEAKFKLGQNRSAADRAATVEALAADHRAESRALAAFCRALGAEEDA